MLTINKPTFAIVLIVPFIIAIKTLTINDKIIIIMFAAPTTIFQIEPKTPVIVPIIAPKINLITVNKELKMLNKTLSIIIAIKP